MRIEELLSHKELIDYTKARTLPAMLGETLFPSMKIEGLEVEMIKGASSLPVAANIHAFDAETEIGSREGGSYSMQELALIKRKIKLGEKELIALNNPRNSAEEKQIIDKIFNDVDNLTNGVLARIEAMRMEALSTGELNINENGFKAKINYGTPNNHKANRTWTANAKILENIYDMCDQIVKDTGFTPTRALTSRAVLNMMLKDEAIRKGIFGVNSDRLLTVNELNQFLAAQSLPQVAIYDAQYRTQAKNGTYTSKRYLDEDKFILMPDGIMGNTFYGVTAEELELRNKADVDLQAVGNIFVEQYNTNDPVAKWVKAVATAMPSFPYADQVGMLTIS